MTRSVVMATVMAFSAATVTVSIASHHLQTLAKGLR